MEHHIPFHKKVETVETLVLWKTGYIPCSLTFFSPYLLFLLKKKEGRRFASTVTALCSGALVGNFPVDWERKLWKRPFAQLIVRTLPFLLIYDRINPHKKTWRHYAVVFTGGLLTPLGIWVIAFLAYMVELGNTETE